MKNLSFIVDTGPDLRTQLLREKIDTCDFAIITHDHSDHLMGIDDLRPFTFLPERKTLPVFAHPIHIPNIVKKNLNTFLKETKFSIKNPYLGGGLPLLNLHSIEKLSEFFPTLNLKIALLPHGSGKTCGLIFDSFSYIIDCHSIPEDTVQEIQQQTNHTLIIDCLQKQEHPSHLWVEKCFSYIDQIAPKRTLLTHMNHELSQAELEKLANQHFDKKNVSPAFDGLKIEI